MAVTQLTDAVVPEIFNPYSLLQTKELSALIQSGLMVPDPTLDAFLAGGGTTMHLPAWRDLANDEERTGSDDPTTRIAADGTGSAPNAHRVITSAQEIAVRLQRNQSWSSMDLVRELSGSDPMMAVNNAIARYWNRRLQAAAFAATVGILADNDASPSGSDTHTQYDLTNDIKGSSYVNGVTNFSAEAFIDTLALLGDAAQDIVAVGMHSLVYATAQKGNLIDFVQDSANPLAERIPTFLGRRVIVDDGMPNPASASPTTTAAGIYDTYLWGRGAFRFGEVLADTPTEFERKPEGGNGTGQSILWTRKVWCIHPTGYAYIGTSPSTGPLNSAASNGLAAAGSWSRRFPERKQIPFARLRTREA